jgi:hypothetical protein
MKKMIVGLTGRRDDGSSMGAGKDAVADVLVREFGFVKVALADEIKRTAQRLYGFTDEQLWGSLEMKNASDERFPREHGPWGRDGRCMCCGLEGAVDTTLTYERFAPRGSPQCYLTPRFVCQFLGSEFGRTVYEDTWARIALGMARAVLSFGAWYTPVKGLYRTESRPSQDVVRGVVIPDVRWPAGNEGQRIREFGGVLWRVDRPGSSGASRAHASESQEAPDEVFDVIVKNNGSLDDLVDQVRRAMAKYE